MTAYQFIFESIPTALLLIAFVNFLPVVFFKSTFLARSILFSYWIWLATFFYLLYCVNVKATPEIALAFLLEFLFLLVYLTLFSKLLHVTALCQLNTIIQLKIWFKIIVVIYLMVFVPLIFNQGFGVFSDSSRIQFMEDSRYNRYAAYFCTILSFLAVPIAAAIINHIKKWDGWIIVFLIISMLSSLLSGSKGGFVMMTISLLSLIQMSNTREYFKILGLPIIAISVAIVSTVIVVGNFISYTNTEMINIMFSRFFYNNDTRALAIDFSEQLNSSGANLLQESFRGLYSLLGYPPINLPLGQLVFQILSSNTDFTGGNTSSTALILAYGSEYEKITFAICLFTLVVAILCIFNKHTKHDILKLALGILLINFLSQDLLAFPLVINILVIFMVCYALTRSIRHLLLRISAAKIAPNPINQARV